MGSQKPKEKVEKNEKTAKSEKDTTARDNKNKQPVSAEPKSQEKTEKAIKKWKGKDWFPVVAPKAFGGKELGDIPTTDPATLTGRVLEVSVSELEGNMDKYYMKLRFKITGLENGKAVTEFDGFGLVREQVFRITRKRTSKVEIVINVETKDKWLLHLKIFAILNRAVDFQIERKLRLRVMELLKEFISTANVEDVVKTACDGLIQKNIKKFGSKIYPIRFCEIVKIDVLKKGKPLPEANIHSA